MNKTTEALDLAWGWLRNDTPDYVFKAISEALAEPVNEISHPDSNCVEADGCPTELAVLQRFWREQKAEHECDESCQYDDGICLKHHYAEPVKQEPVGKVLEGGYEVLLFNRLPEETPLYAAPVGAEVLRNALLKAKAEGRAEALEEAAKMYEERGWEFIEPIRECAAAIRGLK